jgi:hypothetical protein
MALLGRADAAAWRRFALAMQEGSSMEWMCLSLEHLLQPAISFDFS